MSIYSLLVVKLGGDGRGHQTSKFSGAVKYTIEVVSFRPFCLWLASIQASLVMSMESAQGRNGAFVEFVSIFVGELGSSVIVEVVASTFMVIVLLLGGGGGGGEMGLRETVELHMAAIEALWLEVITVRGLAMEAADAVAAWRGTLARVGAGLTTLMGAEPCWTTVAGITGLKLEGAGWNIAAAGMVVGAKEMTGVVGIEKATLKRGRGSPMVGNPPGGERLSGEALGGVSGAYGMDIAGTLGMLTSEMGVGRC